MDSINNTQASATCHSTRPVAGYRLMARDGYRRQSLLTMAESLPQAVDLAKAFCDARNDGPDRAGFVSAVVEEWVGALTDGWWRPVSVWHCRYQNRYRHHHHSGNGKPRKAEPPKVGEAVQCVLLAEKTRKGGWKARLAKGDGHGPIVNSGDVPHGAAAGQTVMLRVAAVSGDGKTMQFGWQAADNPERSNGTELA